MQYNADGTIKQERRASGMLREWTFQQHLAHEAARVKLQYGPQWVATFIDPDELPALNKLDRDVDRCPIIPFFAFRDKNPADTKEEAWEEIEKNTRFTYANLPTDMSLSRFCIQAVQHVLEDLKVVEIDGSTELKKLTVGQKLNCKRRLAGEDSFHFRFRTAEDFCYAIGCIKNRRGYVVTLRCRRETELEKYAQMKLMPHVCDPQKFTVDTDVEYKPTNYHMLREQQEAFGEMRFFQHSAAVGFAIPMHPMLVRPDYSPTQTVGVGSLACMTYELSVFQKLSDDFPDAELTGMPKYKANDVVLFLDVEDVSKNGYPSIISIDQYAAEKTQRLLDTFQDAKVVGMPTSLSIGGRIGRSTTCTYTDDAEGSAHRGVVKAMMVSTLIGNHGVTALFYTKLGQGLFDAHLYLFQQLLKNINFYSERELVEKFSRFRSVNIRLSDQDMPRAYSAASASAENETMQSHLKALMASNDGKAEGRIVQVPASKGGLERPVEEERRDSIVEEDPEAEELEEEEEEPQLPDDETAIPIKGIAHLAQRHAWEDIQLPPEGEDDEGTRAEGTPAEPSTADATTSGAEQERVSAAASPEGADADGSMTDGSPTTQAPPAEGTPTADMSSGQASPEDRGGSARRKRSSVVVTDGTPGNSPNQDQVDEDAIAEALRNPDEDVYFGPSLRDVYTHCCNDIKCKPNSYLLAKLPDNPRFTHSIVELDMSSNYLGSNGFIALLMLVEHLPKVRTLFLNDMTLNNDDVRHLCDFMSRNETVTSLSLRNNPKINIAITQDLTRLLRANRRLTSLSLAGTSLGEGLVARIEADATSNKQYAESLASPTKE